MRPVLALTAALVAAALALAQDAPKTVRALRYRIDVADSGMDGIHGFSYRIEELYFPDRGIVCNLRGASSAGRSSMSAFRWERRSVPPWPIDAAASARAGSGEWIDVPADLADRIFALAELARRQREEGEALCAKAVEGGLLRHGPPGD